MNCVQFEQQVHDLARETLGEVAFDEALAHAELCAGCAQLLADSRALRSGLRSLAEEGAEDGPQQAPPRVEAILLAAFRRERRAEVIRVRRHRWAWVGMAAAAVVILGVTAREWQRHQPRSEAGMRRAAVEVAAGAVAGRVAGPAGRTPASDSASASPAWPRRPGTSGKALKHRATPQRPKPQPQNRPSAGEIEWATDFLPLPYAGNTASPDGGELVQIDLPRSALAELGLPSVEARAETPGEAADDTVTAQVFIGEDGVARAIRFAR